MAKPSDRPLWAGTVKKRSPIRPGGWATIIASLRDKKRFKAANPAFIPGSLHRLRPERTFSADTRRSCVGADWRLLDGVGPRSDMNSNNNALPN
jgi:hypothetical protein